MHSFCGYREGYVFKLGANGLGYYRDPGPFAQHVIDLAEKAHRAWETREGKRDSEKFWSDPTKRTVHLAEESPELR